jgi:hypothetical protein
MVVVMVVLKVRALAGDPGRAAIAPCRIDVPYQTYGDVRLPLLEKQLLNMTGNLVWSG